MTDEFTLMGVEIDWIPKIIQGYVGVRMTQFHEDPSLDEGKDQASRKRKNLMMIIISRKKIKGASPDENGLNDDGNVA
jgi:hypothetical protein